MVIVKLKISCQTVLEATYTVAYITFISAKNTLIIFLFLKMSKNDKIY